MSLICKPQKSRPWWGLSLAIVSAAVAPGLFASPTHVAAQSSSAVATLCGLAPINLKTGSLIHSVTVCPTNVTDYQAADIVAYTWPGATCNVTVRYADGRFAKSTRLHVHRKVGADGRALWEWVPSTKATGPATVTVRCYRGTWHQTSKVGFTLLPGLPPTH
jgi:hypothetical protein